jgi:hypothetical protein
MFRSGDPATVPPHKFQILVNMRRTPGGMVTRPGLELEFDTGVQECINGLTEDAGEQGGALMIYDGGASGANGGTFRAVFPDSSETYSEYVFALYGPASAARGVDSTIVSGEPFTGWGPGAEGSRSHPFTFRGQHVIFAIVDRNGTPAMALVGLNLAPRSFLQATGKSDCWTNASGPVGNPICPGAAGQPTPPNAGDPPLWPFQHPVGSANVLVFLTNPFAAPATASSWVIDGPSPSVGNPSFDSVVVLQERIDDPLTGVAGVSEVLYFVASDASSGPTQRRLIRWDGSLQSTAFAAIPDDTPVALGHHAYGPVLARSGANGGALDWAAVKTEAGSYSVIGGYGWTLGVAPNYWAGAGPGFVRLVNWGGTAHLIVSGPYDGPVVGPADAGERHVAVPLDLAAGEFSDTPSCTFEPGTASGAPVVQNGIHNAVVSGHYCYATATYGAGPAAVLYVGDFLTPTTPVPGIDTSFILGTLTGGWLAVVGGRVYTGTDYLDAGGLFNGAYVHDISDPTSAVQVFAVSNLVGALPDPDIRSGSGALGPPNDDAGGEGFQPS